ncbi:HicB [Pandoraea iniqua]|nr:HicB [Pandoraea iniqua]
MTSSPNIYHRRSAPAAADQYTYYLTWSQEDNEHVGLCAEFPSLSWLDATPDGALRGIREVVAEVVAEMQMNGEAITPSHSHR